MKQLIPPLLFLICIGIMVVLWVLFPEPKFVSFPVNLVGILFIIGGLSAIVSSAKLFRKKDTQIHTFKTPRKLIEEGMFRYSRNPIYLGFSIALLGVWVLLGNGISIAGVLLFFLAANFWYVPFEERNMEKEFGEAYKSYQSRVRRWL